VAGTSPLTVAGQAFLLQVLTNDDVGWTVALFVALGGILAGLTVMLGLWQRDREVLHSEEIQVHLEDLAWPDPRRPALAKRQGSDSRPRWHLLESPTWFLWVLTILAFVVADIVALIWSR
jgi:hypothetical protein